MSDLSPAAQAVLSSVVHHLQCTEVVSPTRQIAAAVLRAAADQVVPKDYDPPRGLSYPEKEAFIDGKCVRNEDIRFALLALASEFEEGKP